MQVVQGRVCASEEEVSAPPPRPPPARGRRLGLDATGLPFGCRALKVTSGPRAREVRVEGEFVVGRGCGGSAENPGWGLILTGAFMEPES